MQTKTKRLPVMIYTEQTPNPESLKYVTNRMLYRGMADFQDAEEARQWSPLAAALFELPYVKGVYIANNFITITKKADADWLDIMLELKSFIKKYLEEEKPIIHAIVRQIKEILHAYVKPAVEMDGGNIIFKSYQDGVVTLELQGACSGCPSSTMTLKAGIESMLKRMIPEIKEVRAIDQVL